MVEWEPFLGKIQLHLTLFATSNQANGRGPQREAAVPQYSRASRFVNVRSIDRSACRKHVKVVDAVDQEVGQD